MNEPFAGPRVLDLLRQVGDEVSANDGACDVFIVGGAAIALTLDAARLTLDVDAVMIPRRSLDGPGSNTTGPIRSAVRVIAEREGLAEDWLNDAAKIFIPDGAGERGILVAEFTGMRVFAADPEVLLAMKTMSAREGNDALDVVTLAEHLRLSTAEQALELTESFYPARPIPARSQYFIQAIFPETTRPVTPQPQHPQVRAAQDSLNINTVGDTPDYNF